MHTGLVLFSTFISWAYFVKLHEYVWVQRRHAMRGSVSTMYISRFGPGTILLEGLERVRESRQQRVAEGSGHTETRKQCQDVQRHPRALL